MGGEAGLSTCGGGGGGGYYGGGGAAWTGGGGGSSYSAGEIVQNNLGVNSGDGIVRIYSKESTSRSPSAAPTLGSKPTLGSQLHCPAPLRGSETYLPPPLAGGKVSCSSTIHSYSGSCMAVESCSGAVFNNLCEGRKKCCAAETTPAKTLSAAALCLDTFIKLFPSVAGTRGTALRYYFNEAASKLVMAGNPSESTQCYRMAAFVAQVGHESSGLTSFEELASGAEYEGKCQGLGNCNPGDGVRFKGRGAIQITGRNNYRDAGAYLGLPLLTNPELASFPSGGFAVTVWFWTANGLNSLATSSTNDFLELTRRINGKKMNGLADRLDRWNDAKRVLQCM